MKEKIRELLSSIDILEKTWKTTTQSLDKSEYIFNRLINEMIDDPGRVSSRNDSYLTTLAKKKDENQILLQHVQESVRKLEESKVYLCKKFCSNSCVLIAVYAVEGGAGYY